jgi:hypothetical protein
MFAVHYQRVSQAREQQAKCFLFICLDHSFGPEDLGNHQ